MAELEAALRYYRWSKAMSLWEQPNNAAMHLDGTDNAVAHPVVLAAERAGGATPTSGYEGGTTHGDGYGDDSRDIGGMRVGHGRRQILTTLAQAEVDDGSSLGRHQKVSALSASFGTIFVPALKGEWGEEFKELSFDLPMDRGLPGEEKLQDLIQRCFVDMDEGINASIRMSGERKHRPYHASGSGSGSGSGGGGGSVGSGSGSNTPHRSTFGSSPSRVQSIGGGGDANKYSSPSYTVGDAQYTRSPSVAGAMAMSGASLSRSGSVSPSYEAQAAAATAAAGGGGGDMSPMISSPTLASLADMRAAGGLSPPGAGARAPPPPASLAPPGAGAFAPPGRSVPPPPPGGARAPPGRPSPRPPATAAAATAAGALSRPPPGAGPRPPPRATGSRLPPPPSQMAGPGPGSRMPPPRPPPAGAGGVARPPPRPPPTR